MLFLFKKGHLVCLGEILEVTGERSQYQGTIAVTTRNDSLTLLGDMLIVCPD